MLDIAFVGIGGWGARNLKAGLENPNRADIRIVGAIDPAPQKCPHFDELVSREIPLFDTLEAFFAAAGADLVILSTPIHLHADQTCLALSHGANVLCEKPLCSTMPQALQMAEAQKRTGLHVAIGYQASFSQTVQRLKGDILAGKLGRPLRMKAIVLWPRDEAYYQRNFWAGMIRDPSGKLVLDSPVNNACSHYLHNMLYLLGDRTETSADPANVTAELYRANPIRNYDTAAIRCRTEQGTELLFITSHATADTTEPTFCYEFEHARIQSRGASFIAHFNDGTEVDYGDPLHSSDRKLWMTIDAVQRGTESICGIPAATAQTQCMWAAQHSQPQITPFPDSLVQTTQTDTSRRTHVTGLDEALTKCYQQWRLPSELGLLWARSGAEVMVAQTDNRMV